MTQIRSSSPKKKILVFAHVPPPHHGQSVMVQLLLDGLGADPRFEIFHVNAKMSDDLEDIGSFRPQKIFRLFKCILQALGIRLRHGPMAFYYVPASAKRSAILRDWMVMGLCRPWFSELILHWHAYGLGEWVAAGRGWPRWLTQRALRGADLSLVLNNYNQGDAQVFEPKQIVVLPNGIADSFPDYDQILSPSREASTARLAALLGRKRSKNEPLGRVEFLFLGHLIKSKGVFVAIEATKLANVELRTRNATWRVHLSLAGSYASEEEKERVFQAIQKTNQATEQEGLWVELVGFLQSGQKKSALEKADCLVFPTFYENEAQPLVLLEAMSAGLTVITTSWRGVPEVLPVGSKLVVPPNSPGELAAAMVTMPENTGSSSLRRAYENRFTTAHHVAALAYALAKAEN